MHPVNRAVFFVVALFSSAFVAFKAFAAGLTHDEAFSLSHYVPLDFTDIIALKHAFPNNHILNTLGMKLFAFLFGDCEFSLRAPNVISYVIYFLSLYGILRRLNNQLLFIPALLLLIANPFLLDFFSLARGYGIAIAMMALAVNRYLHYMDTGRARDYSASLIFACLSVMANMAMLYFFLALLAAHNIIFFLQPREHSLKKIAKHNRATFICIVIFSFLMYEPFRRMINLKLDFGGMRGLWADTISSLAWASSYRNIYGVELLLEITAAFAAACCFAYWIRAFLVHGKKFYSGKEHVFFLCLLPALVLSGSFLHHLLTGTPYLSDRFALFIVPLFWLGLFFLMGQAGAKLFPVLYIPAGLLALFMTVYTVRMLDQKSYFIWKYDAAAREVIAFLGKEHEKNPGRKFKVGISWQFEPVLNYYRDREKAGWLEEFNRNGVQPDDDYIYLSAEDTMSIQPSLTVQEITSFPGSGSLFRNVNQ